MSVCNRERSGEAIEDDEWSYQALCEVPCSQSLCYRAVLISRGETVGVFHRECYLAVSRARATATHYCSPSPHI